MSGSSHDTRLRWIGDPRIRLDSSNVETIRIGKSDRSAPSSFSFPVSPSKLRDRALACPVLVAGADPHTGRSGEDAAPGR